MKASKNFLSIAAAYNYYTFENMPEYVLTDECFAKNADFKKEQFSKMSIPETLQNIAGIEVCVFSKVKQQFKNNFKNEKKEHELYYIDDFRILVHIPGTNKVTQLLKCKDKYSLFPLYEVVNKLQRNTSYEQRKPFLDGLGKPNSIGVFTIKKILSHFEYCEKYVLALEQAVECLNSKRLENEAIIKNTVDSLQGAKVERFNKWTIITTKLFIIEFELLENGNYLSKKITFTGKIEDIINLNL